MLFLQLIISYMSIILDLHAFYEPNKFLIIKTILYAIISISLIMHSIYGFYLLVGHSVFTWLLFSHLLELDCHATFIVFILLVLMRPINASDLSYFMFCMMINFLGLCWYLLYLNLLAMFMLFFMFSYHLHSYFP